MVTRAILALLVLIPIVAWATPAGAPEPTVDDVIQQQITRRAMELIQQSSARRSGKPPTAAALASEAEAVKQAVAEALAKPAAAIPAPIAAPPAAIAAIPPVVVTAPTQVSIPADIRDSIVSLCSLLITAGIAAGLAWMRSHFAFMQEAAANQAVTNSADGMGARLEQVLAKQGKSLSSVEISDPNIAAMAQELLAAYPQWGPLIGLTLDIAKKKVLGGALAQSSAPQEVVPAAAPVVPTAARQNPAEPGITSPLPPPAATTPDPGVVTVTAQAVSPTAVPAPPPTDLEVHP